MREYWLNPPEPPADEAYPICQGCGEHITWQDEVFVLAGYECYCDECIQAMKEPISVIMDNMEQERKWSADD